MPNWDSDAAAHVLRRLGFGGSASDVDNLTSLGLQGAVDSLINYSAVDNSAMENRLKTDFNLTNPNDGGNFNTNTFREWAISRMVLTKRPFEEKMTLFWHNHFATALSKVPVIYMYLQNQTLRSNALARFDTLLLKIAQDPAMLIWLDGITNVAARANENWARELQELFTMGQTDAVTGDANYSQSDVAQIARAFTGWNFHKRTGGGPFDYDFAVTANQHDNGPKTIYGQTANFTGDDVVTTVCNRIATPRFLVKKLFAFFVYELDLTSANDRATIDKFAQVYMSNDHSITALVRAIFTSDEFFSDRARFGLIKSPLELIVGSIRMLGATYNPANGNARDANLYVRSARMGMDFGNPVDVSGWKLNLGWVNTAWMLERFNYINLFVTNRPTNTSTQGAFITADQLQPFAKVSAKRTVRNLLSALGALQVDGPTIKSLRTYLALADNGSDSPWDPSTMADERLRGLIHLIMCLPEYQLN